MQLMKKFYHISYNFNKTPHSSTRKCIYEHKCFRASESVLKNIQGHLRAWTLIGVDDVMQAGRWQPTLIHSPKICEAH